MEFTAGPLNAEMMPLGGVRCPEAASSMRLSTIVRAERFLMIYVVEHLLCFEDESPAITATTSEDGGRTEELAGVQSRMLPF